MLVEKTTKNTKQAGQQKQSPRCRRPTAKTCASWQRRSARVGWPRPQKQAIDGRGLTWAMQAVVTCGIETGCLAERCFTADAGATLHWSADWRRRLNWQGRGITGITVILPLSPGAPRGCHTMRSMFSTPCQQFQCSPRNYSTLLRCWSFPRTPCPLSSARQR
jgi:hypothetical protein